MKLIADLAVLLIALLHVYILVLEMFLWTKPRGMKAFGNTQAKADETAVLAANQGLYNGFLAAGLFWGLLYPVPTFALEIKTFFLLCVIVAGLYGAWSVSRRIFCIQTLPAFVALALSCSHDGWRSRQPRSIAIRVSDEGHPHTPDGRYFVVRGRLWRLSDPSLDEATRQALVHDLMAARRAVRDAKGDPEELRAARARVDAAKRGLGERGPPWWTDGAPDYNRRLARNTPYADWFATLAGTAPPSR